MQRRLQQTLVLRAHRHKWEIRYWTRRGKSNTLSAVIQKGASCSGGHRGGWQPLDFPLMRIRPVFCKDSRTGFSPCRGTAPMTSGGPFEPQESVMWSSQLLALLENEREERRKKQRGWSALLYI
jgi:hypothetical protein